MEEDQTYGYRYVIPNNYRSDVKYLEGYIESEEYRARQEIGEVLFDMLKRREDGVCFWLTREERIDHSGLYNYLGTYDSYGFPEPTQVVEYRIRCEVVQYHNPTFYRPEPMYCPTPLSHGEIRYTKSINMIKELFNRTMKPFSKEYNDKLIKRARKEL